MILSDTRYRNKSNTIESSYVKEKFDIDFKIWKRLIIPIPLINFMHYGKYDQRECALEPCDKIRSVELNGKIG